MTRKNKKTNETAGPVEPPVSFTEEQMHEVTTPPFFVGIEPEETKKLEDFPSTTILSAEVSNDVIITKKPEQELKSEYELIVDLGEKKDEGTRLLAGGDGKPFVSTKQDMRNPTDPFIIQRYEINRIIRKYVDTMQKVIRDPNKTLSEVTPQLFDLMVKEYGYLHSFLEASHNFIRLRAEQLGSQDYVTAE